MKRFGAPNVVPEQFDGKLNYNLSSYLMKHKQVFKYGVPFQQTQPFLFLSPR